MYILVNIEKFSSFTSSHILFVYLFITVYALAVVEPCCNKVEVVPFHPDSVGGAKREHPGMFGVYIKSTERFRGSEAYRQKFGKYKLVRVTASTANGPKKR